MAYQRMYIAVLALDTPLGPETIVGVSHVEYGASTHIAETLEARGFSSAQIGKLLDRVRVDEMRQHQLGCTAKFRGTIAHYFGGRKA